MMKWFKYLGFGLLALVALAAVGLYAGLHLIDQERIKTLIASQVEAATGRGLVIAGEAEPTFSLTPTVRLHDVRFANADWATAPQMLSAKTLDVSLNLLPLLSGQVSLQGVALHEAVLHLEQSGQRANWAFEPTESDTAKAETQTGTDPNDTPKPATQQQAETADKSEDGVSIERLDVTDSVLHYTDHQSGQKETLHIDRLGIDGMDAANIDALELTGRYGETALVLEGERQGDTLRFDLGASRNGASLDAEGSLALSDMTYDATLSAQADTLSGLAALVQQQTEDDTPVSVEAALGGTFELIAFSDLKLSYGPHRLTGAGKLNLSRKTPYIQGALKAATLDLSGSEEPRPAPQAGPDAAETTPDAPAPSTQDNEAAAAPQPLLPDTPLPAQALGALNADLDVAIGSLKTDALSLKDVSATLALQNRRLNISDFKAATQDGRLSGSAFLDASASPPQLGVLLEAREMTLGAVLNELDASNAIEGGRITASLELQGAGHTLRDVLAASNGRFDGYAEEAYYTSPPVEKAAAFFDLLRGGSSEGNIRFRCAIADFAITNGEAESEALALKSDSALVKGDGSISLAAETLRIALTARSSVVGFADVVPPLVIAGSWHDPIVALDAKQNLLNIGKFALGAATGIGLFAVIGEQFTDKLGITADNNPCLASMIEAEKNAANADANPKEALKDAEDKLRGTRDDIKRNVKKVIDDAEEDVKVIRDGVKGLFKKE